MAGLVNDLIAVLDEEAGYYEQLCDLAEEKKEIIVKNDIDSLKRITSRENLIVSKLSRLEKKRLPLVKDIAEVLNEKEANITLKSLVHTIKEQPEAEALQACTEKISGCVNRLKDLNDHNGQLIQSSLDFVDFTINLIRGSLTQQPTILGADGQQLNGDASFLDIKN